MRWANDFSPVNTPVSSNCSGVEWVLVGRFHATVAGIHEITHPWSGERILAEARRSPDREQDGTAVWSLLTLQRAMRRNG